MIIDIEEKCTDLSDAQIKKANLIKKYSDNGKNLLISIENNSVYIRGTIVSRHQDHPVQ